MIKNILISLLLASLLAGLCFITYQKGYHKGAEEIRTEWELDKSVILELHNNVLLEMARKEEAHRLAQQKVSDELAQAKENYRITLSEQSRDYEQRLLQSARRAEIYYNQAQAGAIAQRNLASHAAQLDRTVEEGRHLVGELRETLRLRDAQLIQLGQQIKADRTVLDNAHD